LIFVTVNIELTLSPDLVPEQITSECELRDVIQTSGLNRGGFSFVFNMKLTTLASLPPKLVITCHCFLV